MTTAATMRFVSRAVAALIVTVMAGCQLIIGLDDYYLAPDCPVGAALCIVCNDAADCGAADACHTWSCVAHLCQPVDAAADTACAAGVCSDSSPSTCVECNDDARCEPGAHCYEHACFRCDDGMQNGDERGIDCGGVCPECLGIPGCLMGSDCKSGFCADGRCCAGACTDICQFCDLDGDCKNVPKYQSDDPSCFGGGKLCNGGGECRLGDSAICMADVECVSAKCINMTCVP